jgi:hypothetical protein
MLTREKAIKECKKSFNHLGIYGGFTLCRLIGFGEDNMDFYYHLVDAYGEDSFCSMVGGFYSIKGMSKKGYVYTNVNFSYSSPEAVEFTITKLKDN